MLQKLVSKFHRRQCSSSQAFFEYTSGRFLFNEERRLRERRVHFDVEALRRAAVRCGQGARAVQSMVKLPEGTFNKVFLLTLDTGDEIIARIPNPNAEPLSLVTASEVATMAFARDRLGIPVPKILAWEESSLNDVKSAYILMEKARGVPLQSLWPAMDFDARCSVVSSLAKIEGKFTAHALPSGGSLYFDKPSLSHHSRVGHEFTVGPSTDRHFWRRERQTMDLSRGPWSSPQDYLAAIALREKAYISAHARPFPHGFERDELGELAESITHLQALDQYLALTPYLVPKGDPSLYAFHLWHPDLHSRNIFVSPSTRTSKTGNTLYEITDIIDWQHAVVAPMYLQAQLSQFIEDIGAKTSHPGEMPSFPDGYEAMSKEERQPFLDAYKKQAVLCIYYATSKKESPGIRAFFSHPILDLLAQPTHMAGATWGNSWTMDLAPFRSSIANVVQRWDEIQSFNCPHEDIPTPIPCPVQIDSAQLKKLDEQLESWTVARSFLETVMAAIGIDQQGWVPSNDYDAAKSRNAEALARFLNLRVEDSDDEELTRAERMKMWPFQDGAEDLF